MSTLTTDARKRLQTIEEFSDLGSGFNIAMKDLDIRGAGNLLGGEQSGFITDIGYETYQKILEEAIQELKETDFKELFKEDLDKEKIYVRDVQIDTDIEMLIPDAYVKNTQERLSLYTQMDSLKDELELQKFGRQLKDRFGKIPRQVRELSDGLRLRWACKKLGFERVILKNRKLRCYFIEDPQSRFYESDLFSQLMNFLAKDGVKYGLHMKKSQRHMIVVRDGVKTLKQARMVLDKMKEGVEIGV